MKQILNIKNEELAKKWEKIYHLRKEVNKKLEAERQAGMIGHSLDARVLLNISMMNIHS